MTYTRLTTEESAQSRPQRVPNIGLIVSLSTYARVNPYGFIETPYRKVQESMARGDVSYLTAMDEKDYPIAQANAALDEKGHFRDEQISARKAGEFVMVPPSEISYMDVSQINW